MTSIIGKVNGVRAAAVEEFFGDLKIDEIEPKKPCATRLGNSSWCFKPEGHGGDCEGAEPEYGPRAKEPELWRRHKGRSR